MKGIVITSGKKDFAAGMDLNVIAGMKDRGGAQAVFDGVMTLHHLLRKIELAGMDPKTKKGGKPIAAALPGTALGIGLELPLATHRIFAADNPKAKIGLPEIMVGIFPGAGGTTRLVRKLGAMVAAPFLLEGKLNEPKKAKAAGIIDEVVPRPAGRRQGMGAGGEGGRSGQALGRQGLQDARRRAVPPGGLHDLCRRQRDGAWQDDGRLSGGQGAAVGGL